MVKQRSKKSKGFKVEPTHTEITEEEQWRLINESGILNLDSKTVIPRPELAEEEDHSDKADEIFDAILLIIPFTFLYLMMDILIHQQYGKHPAVREYARRLASAVPVLSAFIFYTNRHKPGRIMQLGLFLASLAVGSRLIWLVNRAPWHITIRQGPPLATIWIYTIAIMNLLPAVVSLCLVAAWVWSSGLKLIF